MEGAPQHLDSGAESGRDPEFSLLPYTKNFLINPDSISNMFFLTRSQFILIRNNMCIQTLFVPSENMTISISHFQIQSSSGEFWNYIIYQDY